MAMIAFGSSLLAVILSAGLALARPTRMAPTGWPPPTPWPSPAVELPPTGSPANFITLAATPPVSASVPGFVGHPQSLPLSCESRSAVDWANLFGFPIGEIAFFRQLPIAADPDLGFVGGVMGAWGQLPPNSYGVHAGPVARLLQDLGDPAHYHLYTPWPAVQAGIAAGRA